MNSGRGSAATGGYRPLSKRQAAQLIARYSGPPEGFSRVLVIGVELDTCLMAGDGAGRLAHPLIGITPVIEGARILRIEPDRPGEVRVHVV